MKRRWLASSDRADRLCRRVSETWEARPVRRRLHVLKLLLGIGTQAEFDAYNRELDPDYEPPAPLAPAQRKRRHIREAALLGITAVVTLWVGTWWAFLPLGVGATWLSLFLNERDRDRQ